MNDKATPARPQSAEQFHKTECGIAIPLYAVLDENRQGRQPMPKEILAKVYEFAEAYADSELSRLRAEHDRDLFNLKASNSDMWHELREVLGIPLDDVKWFPSALVHQVGDLMERVEKSEAERDGLRDAKPKYAVGVSVLLTRGNQLLLGKRKNISAAGLYSTPGGRIEPDEDMARCAIREFHEETGAVLGGFTFIDYCEHTRFGHHYFMFYAHATDYEGEIVNTQPDKCEGWEWIDLNRLPGNCTEPPKVIDLLGRTLAALSDPPEGETR